MARCNGIKVVAVQVARHRFVIANGAHPGAGWPRRQSRRQSQHRLFCSSGTLQTHRIRACGQPEQVDVMIAKARDQGPALPVQFSDCARQA